jgi:aryl-alcohol dehydrogenase-like predicted oxidoreductase
MEKRRLGRTGHESTVVTFGTAGIGRVSQAVADTAVEQILQHGVNHIDIAPTYGEAMERMAPWMPKIRDSVFLGAKTRERTRKAAWQNIESCMRRLGVDSFDLFQLHSVGTMDDLDAVTGSGGALEALVELRERGMTRWVGITGHGPDVPRVHLEALRRFDFDTVMFPLNATLWRNSSYREHAVELLSVANDKDVGIHTIKMLARGGWGEREREHSTWYDPHREQAAIDGALWWLLCQPMHTAPSVGDVRLLPRALDAAERFRTLSPIEQADVVSRQSPPLPEPGLGILAAD